MPSQIITTTWTRLGEQLVTNVPLTADGEVNADPIVAATTTNAEVDIALKVASLVLLLISSDQTLTIKTNSTGSPGDTLTVSATKPLVWYTGCGLACPLSTDVTKLYISNAAISVANIKIRTLSDVTP